MKIVKCFGSMQLAKHRPSLFPTAMIMQRLFVRLFRLLGKVCLVKHFIFLSSSGVAPINETTWKLLQAKCFEGPLPMLSPVPTLAGAILPPDFNVLTILKSFSKTTACGPSGLRIQHLLNAAEVPLPCALLRDVVNFKNLKPNSHYHIPRIAGVGRSFTPLGWEVFMCSYKGKGQ